MANNKNNEVSMNGKTIIITGANAGLYQYLFKIILLNMILLKDL
jgi:hypothetical protein